MVKRKPAKNLVSAPTVGSEANASGIEASNFIGETDGFPFARYTSIVGVNSSLMLFVALFLPRSKVLFDISDSEGYSFQRTSRDRPQHPFLEPLTANPVSTLAYICLGVIVLQAWWSAWIRHWWIDQSLKGARDDKKMQKQSLDRRKLAQYGKAWIFVLGSSLVFYTILVLMGAPFISHVPQTFLLALILAVLTIAPPAYTFGPIYFSSDTESLLVRLSWTRLFAEFQIRSPIERAMVYPAVGSILGSWLGTIPIALDWDRPWQAWPLTTTYGALFGYISGSMVALTVNGIKVLADEHLRTLNDSKRS